MSKWLETIRSPSDIKNLDTVELQELACEIRELIISTVAVTGGHLAPNLGVVEITLALYSVFDFPTDKIVWDVGHQAYAHKILTGRLERFHTLRNFGGISGFPKIDESPYDAFGTGHASTAISAALGMATARDLKGEDYRVIALVGDGALSGGVAFEGLNNAGGSRRDMTVVLNDNSMSISPNVGALSRHLTQIITAPLYNKIKEDMWWLSGRLPRGSKRLRDAAHRIEEGLKAMLVPGILFERLGFRYFGPVDGHDLPRLIRLFKEIKRMRGPILVHLVTTKGKGYKFAEEDATRFHGLGSFCQETGVQAQKKSLSYTDIFADAMVELGSHDQSIIAITAAMADGTGLIRFAKAFPDRFFDVGIAEQHAVLFAAGLGLKGFKPVVAIYSTFLQRAFDQVIHDVALQNIPVIIVMDRAGLVGEDGPTHHGSFDLSYLRLIPNLVLMAPADENELRDMLFTALRYGKGPVAIRYPRGESTGRTLAKGFREIPLGKGKMVREGKDIAILAVGDRVLPSLAIADRLSESGVSAEVVNMRFVKPLDTGMIDRVLQRFNHVVTLENNTIVGGFGGAVAERIAESGLSRVRFKRFGLPDRFVTHGRICDLMALVALDVNSVTKELIAFVGRRQGKNP